MCGIVYAQSFVGKPVNRIVKNRYLDQRRRGSDGFGFYIPTIDRLTHNPREGRILSLLRRQRKASEILFHHRMPTSTANVRNACHPFSTKDTFGHNYIVVHNGVLWNERQIKPMHDIDGIKYISEQEDGSFNDSETLAYDIAQYLEGETDRISVVGSIAFIAIQRTHDGKPVAVYFGRNNGNPLVMKFTKKDMIISSEGKGVLIEPNKMYRFDYKTKELTSERCIFPSGSTNWKSYGGMSDYSPLPEEIDWNEVFQDMGIDEGEEYLSDSEKRREARAQFVKQTATRLMEDNFDDLESALQAGRRKADELEKLIESLRPIMDNYNATMTEEDLDRYYGAQDTLYYIKNAVKLLESEGREQSQLGFRYNPNPENGYHPIYEH